MKIIILIIFSLISQIAFAEKYVIKNKAYLNTESGQFVYGQYIYTENNKIIKIDSHLDSKNFKLIDLSNLYLTPGFFDCHSHVLFAQIKSDRNLQAALSREARLKNETRIDRAKKYLTQYLNEGFTYLCDLGNSGNYLDSSLKKEISNDSNFPTLFISGPGLAVFPGQFSDNEEFKYITQEYSILRNPKDVDPILMQHLANGVDILKIFLDNNPNPHYINNEILKAIFDSKHLNKFKKITFHSVENISLPSQLANSIYSIEHFGSVPMEGIFKNLRFISLSMLDESTQKEFSLYQPYFSNLQNIRAKKALASEFDIVFGPDYYFDNNEFTMDRGIKVKNTIEAFSKIKYQPLSLLKMLTINPANSLGLKSTIGNIKENSDATLLGFSRNPFLNINNIKKIDFILNKGSIYKAVK